MRLPLGSVYDILWHGRVAFTGKFVKVADLSVFSRVLPCGFSGVRNRCETSNRFNGGGKQTRIFKMFICVKPSLFESSLPIEEPARLHRCLRLYCYAA